MARRLEETTFYQVGQNGSRRSLLMNFVAGTARRVPVRTQKAGLEWLWRIKKEPDLWRSDFLDSIVLPRLLMRASAELAPHGGRVEIADPAPNVRRIFRYACAEFLLDPPRAM